MSRRRAAGGATGHFAADADISVRRDLDAVLRRFGTAALADHRIGPFFTEIAGAAPEARPPGVTDVRERAPFRPRRPPAHRLRLARHPARGCDLRFPGSEAEGGRKREGKRENFPGRR
ncbi:hypothetical protein GCM10010371_37480 [Streptomyces subrutilus]|uniref:Uncharacterized protein n=1 Tax=Streptomyces subrutilus TaxID=36818 RepID=A0A918QUR3_9ACTN|nr:hypothetical protein GCM10010371_37480 [Streptomyces subrutilus]